MQRGGRWARRIYFLLGLLLLAALVGADEPSRDDEQDLGSGEDVCAPLVEARSILASLQPEPFAHLEGKVGTIARGRGWGDGFGWSHDGPLSTTLRLLPRLLHVLSPATWLSSILSSLRNLDLPSPGRVTGGKGKRSGGGGPKVTRKRRERVERVMALLDEAEAGGCSEVWGLRGQMRLFPPKGIRQDIPAAYAAYGRYLETTPDPEAQFFLGFFHATGLGGAEQDQGKATLYYTFAALQGYRPAEMALGYRHWAGIGVKEDCLNALDYYEAAAEKAYAHHLDGPPGGRTLPLTPTRLSDRFGGIYGPHASWASTGANAHRAAIKATSAVARGETEKEVLEYYQYHSDRDSHLYTVRLGKLFYLGSVYFLPGGVASGAEGVGEIPQDFRKAKEYFMKVARVMWPIDFEGDGRVAGRRKMGKEQEEQLREPAMVAASYLGRMAMRGEGGKADYRRARLWYERAAELGDREAMNGLGIIHRDGLLVPVDKGKATHFFQASAGQDLAEAQVNLAKTHLDRGELIQATQLLDAALRHGSPFEAFHLLSNIHAQTARLSSAAGGRPGMCGVAVAWYKLVSERGSWTDGYMNEAERAWGRGEEDKALLGWMVASEMGYEAGQNNVAFVLSGSASKGLAAGADSSSGLASRLGKATGLGGRGALSSGVGPSAEVGWVKEMDEGEKRERELVAWMRSAAQDNVDAMVMVGDYFYRGLATPKAPDYERAATYYQTAAETQTSAMAYWNLGWMYENGEGVPRDWHLAKRFYDLCYEVNAEAYLPVVLSLVGLHLRSWWVDLRSGGAIPGLSLFEAEDDMPGTWDRLKSLFSPPPLLDDELDPGLDREDGVEDFSGAGWAPEDGDLDEDLLETAGILLLGGVVMALIWIRGRWAAMDREREERQRREGRVRGDALGGAGGQPVGGVWEAGEVGLQGGQGGGLGEVEAQYERMRRGEGGADGLGLGLREDRPEGLPLGWEPPIP